MHVEMRRKSVIERPLEEYEGVCGNRGVRCWFFGPYPKDPHWLLSVEMYPLPYVPGQACWRVAYVRGSSRGDALSRAVDQGMSAPLAAGIAAAMDASTRNRRGRVQQCTLPLDEQGDPHRRAPGFGVAPHGPHEAPVGQAGG